MQIGACLFNGTMSPSIVQGIGKSPWPLQVVVVLIDRVYIYLVSLHPYLTGVSSCKKGYGKRCRYNSLATVRGSIVLDNRCKKKHIYIYIYRYTYSINHIFTYIYSRRRL